MLAIVLSRRDFREFDQIISLYTKETGKREALARGVKKMTSKNAAFLEPCSLAEVEIVRGKEIDHVTKVQSADIFTVLRQDLGKLAIAWQAIKLIDQIIAVEQTDERIFNLIKHFLEFINDAPVVNSILITAFILRLFSYLGFTPQLEQCRRCGTEIPAALPVMFDLAAGGVLCSNCRLISPVSGHPLVALGPVVLAHLRTLLVAAWDEINSLVLTPADQQTIDAAVHQFAVYHSGRQINEWRLLERMMA